YEYLLRGDAGDEGILEQGDIVFVPLRGAQVSLVGSVMRPARYELGAGEDLIDVLTAAGGFSPDARRQRITIHRVLALAERGPSLTTRAAIDLALAPSADHADPTTLGGVSIPPVGLQDGDSIVVDGLPGLQGGYFVTVRERVQSPGRFPWRPG